MARTRDRQRRESATKRWKARKDSLHDLEALAVLMLADAEDDEELLVALTVAQIVADDMRMLRVIGGGRYGPRGFYDRQKSKDIFDLLLYNYTDRWFKTWLR